MDEQALFFGSFTLFPSQRLLLRDDKPLKLGSRALDILLVLAARAGEIIPKEVILSEVWPDTFVEEASLRVHMVNLRKALGDDQADSRFITNVPGRGYCFVAPVTRRGSPPVPDAAPPPLQSGRLLNFPATIARPIGRDETVRSLTDHLSRRRLLTIAGPGGIGKTTVALAIAQASAARYPDGAAFVDLAPVIDPALVPAALAAVVGHIIRSDQPVAELVAALRDRQMLVVLDGCEHVIAEATGFAEALLRGTTGITLLVSSREPLRAEGEWIHRLPPLDVPQEGAILTAAQALGFSAVRLFVERMSAGLGGYELREADAPIVAEICRRLDGIALAIELAAGRVDTLGLRGIADSLDDCFHVLTRGRRTALPRHQTLKATLDWSHGLLPVPEQVIFRRLAVFNGGFGLAAAVAILADDGLDEIDIEDGLSNLAAKSLLTTELQDGGVRYRLLDTTRTYGKDQLARSGEAGLLRQQHGEYYRDLFRAAEADWETRPSAAWLTEYLGHTDNLRAALDWAFSPDGDPATGVALTVAAVPLWFQLSLIDECLIRVQTALAHVETASGRDERRRMQLYAMLGWPRMRALAGLPSGAAAWATALDIAEQLGDLDYQARALWALWVDRSNQGLSREALALADRYCAVVARTGDGSDLPIGDRMRARSLHLLGHQAEARRLVTRMLDSYVAPTNRSHLVRFQFDQRMTARITLARVLWVQGHPDEAMQDVARNLADAQALNHMLTLAHVLSDAACPVALLAGDLETARHYVALLRHHTQLHSLDVWHTYADCFEGEILIRTGDAEAGVALLRSAIAKLEQGHFVLYRTAFLGSLAQGLGQTGQTAEGLAVLDAALAQCAETGEAWYLPELHRLRGELLAPTDAAGAEAAFRSAIEIAASQDALSWQQRAAASLARLRPSA